MRALLNREPKDRPKAIDILDFDFFSGGKEDINID